METVYNIIVTYPIVTPAVGLVICIAILVGGYVHGTRHGDK